MSRDESSHILASINQWMGGEGAGAEAGDRGGAGACSRLAL